MSQLRIIRRVFPNIKVYTVVPEKQLRLLKMSRYLGWLLAHLLLCKAICRARFQKVVRQPRKESRGKTLLWGRVEDSNGNSFEARMQGPEGYKFTVLTALKIVERIQSGQLEEGFQTPAGCYGADMVMEIEGVKRN